MHGNYCLHFLNGYVAIWYTFFEIHPSQVVRKQTMRKSNFIQYTALILSMFFLQDCSNINVFRSSDIDPNLEDSMAMGALLGYRLQKASISGKAMKGELRAARVDIHPLTSSGSCNTSLSLGNSNTDELGNYSVTFLRTGASVCVRISADPRGISRMLDEKTGRELPLPPSSTFELTNIINESSISGVAKSDALVSPFSSMLSRRVTGKTKEIGKPLTPSDMDKVVRAAGKEVVIRFGLNKGFGGKSLSRNLNDSDFPDLNDIKFELNNNDNPVTQNLNLLQAAFSTLGDANKTGSSVSIEDIAKVLGAFNSDMEDGKPDGKGSDGNSVTVNGNPMASNPISCGGDPSNPAIQNSCVMGGAFKFAAEGGSLPGGVKLDTASIKNQAQSMVAAETAVIIAAEPPLITPVTKPPVLNYITSGNLYVGVSMSYSPSNTGDITTACSISPALPAGLTLSADCSISGTPTATSSNSYTITGSNDGGSGSTTLTLSISNPPAPANLLYAGSPFTFLQGTSIPTQTPSVSGIVSSCSVSPALPSGLSLSSNCAITGTPASTQSATSYTVSATNLGGTTTATISITVNPAPPSGLSYVGSPFTFTQASAISTQTPSVTGTVTSCSSTPALPAGLSLNSTTCAISGTPSVSQVATDYTITASNVTGSTTATISIYILIQPPSSLTYPGSPFLFVQNSAIATQTPTVTGTISSCSSSPALPSGLSLNSANCVLSGTPTVLQGAANYTITATNSTGSTSTTISIEISDLPIQCLSYTSISGDDRYKALTNTTTLCDNTVMNGSWVRFTGTYSQLSTSSAGYSLCNTSATGYLNTALPSTRGQVVSGTVCYHWTTSNCEFSNTIQITHCGTYFVYQLPIPPNCSLRYCTQ